MKRANLPSQHAGGVACIRAMTLIELIVVMGLLATVMAFSAPVLSRFFRGRSLTEEARRVLALTRFGRSEAISRSVPMELWLNPTVGSYGVRPQAGYESEDAGKPVEYNLSEGLSFDLAGATLDENGDALILFQPDGTIGEESPEKFKIQNSDQGETIEIAKTDPIAGYAIGDYGKQ